MLDSSIDERLSRLKEQLDKLLNSDSLVEPDEATSPEHIADVFGLSHSQAKAWLKKEPNYSSDVSYHEPRKDDKLTEPFFPLIH